MNTGLTRRSLVTLGSAAACASLMDGSINTAMAAMGTPPAASLPWPWKQLSPADVQERAYQSASAKRACMYGVGEGVLGTLAEKWGAPYNTFPIEAFLYGSGGYAGLGSLCGTINASGFLFGLFARNQQDVFSLCREISMWFESTALPSYQPEKPRLDAPAIATVSGSTLCNAVSAAWIKASGGKPLTPPYFDRCDRMVADVAMKAVSLLNGYAARNTRGAR